MKNRKTAAVKIVLTCLGRHKHEWLHDTRDLFQPRVCISCGQPYSIRTRPAE